MVRRGDLYLVDYGDPIGHEAGSTRPALVLSVDAFHRSGLAVTLPLTSTKRPVPTSIEVENDGLHHTSYIQVDQIRTVSQDRLGRHLGTSDEITLARVEHVIGRLLGFRYTQQAESKAHNQEPSPSDEASSKSSDKSTAKRSGL